MSKVDKYTIVAGAFLIALGVVFKLFLTGEEFDIASIAEYFGSSKRGNIVSTIIILIIKFATSSFGYICLIALGSLMIAMSLNFKKSEK